MLMVPVAGISGDLLPAPRALSPIPLPAGPLPVYAAAFVDRQSIGISDSRFIVPVLMATAGLWSWNGIGIELGLGRSISDDSLNNFNLEVYSSLALNLRFESPPTNRIAAYALFGLARSNIKSGFSGDVINEKKNSFLGAQGAVGLTYRLSSQFAVDTSFTHHDYDEDIGINSFRVGLRYDFSGYGR